MTDACLLIDSHCHLDAESFADPAAELAAARAAGVTGLVVPAVLEPQWQRLAQLHRQFKSVQFALGVHPWWVTPATAAELSAFKGRLLQAAGELPCVAIGESGVDGLRGPPLAVQAEWLALHAEVAVALDKPLIVHAVRSHDTIQPILKRFRRQLRGVIHAFSGGPELARQYWQAGFYLGIGGTITYARASKTRRAVAELPLAALLLETDAPDMPLAGCQGQINRPQALAQVASCLAELRGEPLATIAAATRHNTEQLFGLQSAFSPE
ncbi:TatD family hydrolase [Halioxenophilus sp. WMMB6]|uniref:TatD family hydrolase n=1 Tax=Halioxenophilus sp. WMMB6 TaxID=3073815 RepID=UPI00295E67D7|nr:TatD family hydrolase [Halioxenophilus sp. WMMB6]